jgi:hypothetical protein
MTKHSLPTDSCSFDYDLVLNSSFCDIKLQIDLRRELLILKITDSENVKVTLQQITNRLVYVKQVNKTVVLQLPFPPLCFWATNQKTG